ncbi:MAG: toll/interleukin-1 receptor domain-containing protein [Peptostreptococcaceae bacterium]|nr:toll/interleukin-1 receptor domain-containing protein [Peptostreptococcaceae bacterium]
MNINPKVFVSYSHDDENHIEWVKKLSADMKNHSIDVVLDKFDLKLGDDLRFFMENASKESSFVLCVCSENYVKKSNAGEGGAGYESTIISFPLLSNSKINSIIPIIRNNKSEEKTPIFLKSKFYIDFTDDDKYYEKYRELIARILGADELIKPNLGTNPFNTDLSNNIKVNTKIDSIKYKAYPLNGTVIFESSNNNHLFTIGTGEYEFQTSWNSANAGVVYATGNVGFNNDFGIFPEYKEISKFNFSSGTRRAQVNDIIIWQNHDGRFMGTKIIDVKSRSHGAHHDEVTFEYKIYIEADCSKA